VATGHGNSETRGAAGRRGDYSPGAGRPVSSTHALSEAFLDALDEHILEHGAEAIQQTYQKDPVAYITIVASLLSRALDVQVDPYEQLTDQWLEARIDELLERVARIRAELARAQALVTDAEGDPCKH